MFDINEYLVAKLDNASKETVWFKVFETVTHTKNILESYLYDKIVHKVGFYFDDFTFDTYDSSIEFHGVQNTGRLNSETQAILRELGLYTCWLNHQDGTDTTYYGFREKDLEGTRSISHKSWCNVPFPVPDQNYSTSCRRKSNHLGDHSLKCTEEDLISIDN